MKRVSGAEAVFVTLYLRQSSTVAASATLQRDLKSRSRSTKSHV